VIALPPERLSGRDGHLGKVWHELGEEGWGELVTVRAESLNKEREGLPDLGFRRFGGGSFSISWTGGQPVVSFYHKAHCEVECLRLPWQDDFGEDYSRTTRLGRKAV
jgi:hypothetical protein